MLRKTKNRSSTYILKKKFPVGPSIKHSRTMRNLEKIQLPPIAKQIGHRSSQVIKNNFENISQPKSIVNILSMCAYKSRSGEDIYGKKKSNQDSIIVSQSKNTKNQYFFCICDGHGTEGREISQYMKSTLPRILEESFLPTILSEKDIITTIDSSIKTTEDLLLSSGIDAFNSGCTLCSVLITNDVIYCCNIGDSRAILVSFIDSE